MRNLSKSVFLDAMTCPALGWRTRRGQGRPPTLGEQFRMEQGQEIGQRARALFTDAVSVSDRDVARAAAGTQRLVEDQGVETICEGTFLAGETVARADVLERVGSGWRLTEVKSASNASSELVEDLAYTAMVCREAGLPVQTARLLLVSKAYRLWGRSRIDCFRGTTTPRTHWGEPLRSPPSGHGWNGRRLCPTCPNPT